jgi:hypothetical protein
VAGDGSDWNLTELGILGDISIAVSVTIFDNGHHTAPVPHVEPFAGTLDLTPGVLLRNGRGQPPADWAEVTLADGQLDTEGYYGSLPMALAAGVPAGECQRRRPRQVRAVTIPGLGFGQFAGPFRGQLGAALQAVLERFLKQHGVP